MTAQPLEARKRISQAAFGLFGRKGYTCTSVQDIANAAEVKKSIVYYYFGSKEGLYQALLSESSAHLETFLSQALTGVGLNHPAVTARAPLARGARPRPRQKHLPAARIRQSTAIAPRARARRIQLRPSAPRCARPSSPMRPG